MKQGIGDEVSRALTVTRLSRLQVLKGLATAGVVATLAPLACKPASAQIPPGFPDLDPKTVQDLLIHIAALKGSNAINPREMFAVDLALGDYEDNALNPNYTVDDMLKDAFRAQEQYDRGVAGDFADLSKRTLGEKILWYAAAIPGEKIPKIGEWYGFFAEPLREHYKPDRHLAGLEWERQVAQTYQGKEDQWLVGNLLRRVPKFMEFWDRRYGKYTGLKVSDIGKPDVSTIDVMQTNLGPEAAKRVMRPETAQKLRDAPKNSDGSFAITKDQLIAIFSAELGELEKMAGETLQTVKEIDAKQDRILQWQTNQDAKEAARHRAQLEAVERQTLLAGARSTVYLVSMLVGLGDKKVGNQLSAVGNSAIQIYDSVAKHAETMANLGELAKLSERGVGLAQTMAGAVLAGNVVGAVMGLVSAFVGAGPSIDEVILREVGKLRQQVEDVRLQMHERFDRIEQGLTAIFKVCTDNFDKLQEHLIKANQKLDHIQEDLARQEILLGNLGKGLDRAIVAGFRHDYAATFNKALGFERGPGGEDPLDSNLFNEYEGELRTWATYDCLNELEQRVAGRSWHDDRLYYELNRYPIQENVKYLSNWLVDKGLPGFVDAEKIANPITWGIAAGAYAQLRLENPKHASSTFPKNQPKNNAQVEEVGWDLLRALRRITVEQEIDGVPKPNHSLFAKLVANYKEKAAGLEEALRIAENAYVQNELGFPKVDPWGAPDQKIVHTPAQFLENQPRLPNNLTLFIPPEYLLADYLKAGGFKLGADIWYEWVDKEEIWTGGWYDIMASLKVSVGVTDFSGSYYCHLERFVKSPKIKIQERHVVLGGVLGNQLSAQRMFEENWETGWNLKTKFETDSQFAVSYLPRAGTTYQPAVADLVEAELRKLRQRLCLELIGEGRELDGNGQLGNAAERLDGAKAVLEAFVNLGMPVALESDDFIRAMLYGRQSLVDRQQVKDRYLFATRFPTPLYYSYVWIRGCDMPSGYVWYDRYQPSSSGMRPVHLGDHPDEARLDATFRMVPGLVDDAEGSISFESLSKPGHYLSWQNGLQIGLYPSDQVPRENATFWMVEGLADAQPKGVSFKSYSLPNHYINHVGLGLFLNQEEAWNTTFRRYSTFYVVAKDVRGFSRKDADARADALYKPGPEVNKPEQGATGILADYLKLIGEKKHVEGPPIVNGALLRSRAVSVVTEALAADKTKPKVSSVVPANDATGVRRNVVLKATFSRKMDRTTLTRSTFKLYRINADGSSTQVPKATVTPSADGMKATLNPYGTTSTLLAKSTRYKAVVTTGAKDVAGNPLDQDPAKTGNQQMVWSFKTGSR